jgi:hypothetical protein
LKNPALEAKKLMKKTEFVNTNYIETLVQSDNPELASQVSYQNFTGLHDLKTRLK